MIKKVNDIASLLTRGKLKQGRGNAVFTLHVLAVTSRTLIGLRGIKYPRLFCLAVEIVIGETVKPGPIGGDVFGPGPKRESKRVIDGRPGEQTFGQC